MPAEMSRRTFFAASGGLLALAALQACAPVSSGTGTTSGGIGTTEDDRGTTSGPALEAAFEKAFAASGMAGAAVRVRLPGQSGLWRSTAGYSDLSTKSPFDPGDYVRIASITKSFVATAVLRMVDERLVSLDDTLDRWYPQIPDASVITLEQMLGMRSGIFDFTSEKRFGEEFDADPTMAWDLDDTLAVILRNEPAFAPGTRVAYCDSNYALLGAIAEKVDGSPLDEVLKNRVIDPAGLTSTYYPVEDGMRSPHPQGYVPKLTAAGAFDTSVAPRVVNDVNPRVAAGAGSIISTLDDVSAWGDQLVSGTLLRPETQARRMQTQQFSGIPLPVGYGLGVMNINEYIGHDGAIFGFSSVVMTRPSTGTQISIVGNESTNSTTPTLTMALALLDVIDPSQSIKAP